MNPDGKIKINSKYERLLKNDIDNRYILITGGRGSGKSFAVSLWLVLLLCQKGYKILYTRYTLTSAHISIIPEFVEKINMLGLSEAFVITKNSVKSKLTGSEIIFKGIKSGSGSLTANLKSLSGVNVWVLDEAEELNDKDLFEKIDFSIRDKKRPNKVVLIQNPSHKEHWIYKRFFAGKEECFSGETDEAYYIHSTYKDNKENLSETYKSLAERSKETNLLSYNHTWLGHWITESDKALFKFVNIDNHRIDDSNLVPDLIKVAVAIDPAVTSKKSSDETGIITAGKSADGHYYILSDLSGRYSPSEWAVKAIAEYKDKKADKIVAEVNQGGDMVENTLLNIDREIPYTSVRATRGKVVRAEPIAALYEKGLVHHVGTFTQLESQMISFDGSDGNEDDRIDALVWALTFLSENSIGEFKVETISSPKDKISWADVY